MNEVSYTIADWHLDNDSICSIRRTVFIEEQSVPETLEWDDEDQSATHFLIRIDKTSIGTARLTTEGQIGRMAILEPYRRKGYGSNLMRYILKYASSKKLSNVYLHAQTSADAFYEKNGFDPVGGVFEEAGILHRKMQIQLKM